MRAHSPIRPTCELSLTKEDLPIEEEVEIPSERPTAPFKSHEYSVISAQQDQLRPVEQRSFSLTSRVSAKQLELEERLKVMKDLETAVRERNLLNEMLTENISQVAQAFPSDSEATIKEIHTYKATIEARSRNIGSQSRRLKEYEGHIARRLHQLSETKLRLEDVRLDLSKNICHKRELYRALYAFRRLLAEPSGNLQFQLGVQTVKTALKLGVTESSAESGGDLATTPRKFIAEQREAVAQLLGLKLELMKPSYLATQIGALTSQIKAEMRELTEISRERLESDIAKQAQLLLN
jgi:hypothetical protein